MIVFLDTEFTDLLNPDLLSMGLVTFDGREHYVELDLTSELGQARKTASSDFVRHGGVLQMWGRMPDAACTAWEMGRRTGEWLLGLSSGPGPQIAASSRSFIEVAYDYSADYELMEYAIRDSGIWEKVREAITPVNIAGISGCPEGEIASEECYRELTRRNLHRHHALADALALRASYIAARAIAVQMASRKIP